MTSASSCLPAHILPLDFFLVLEGFALVLESYLISAGFLKAG